MALDAVVGYAMPLRKATRGGWETGPWGLRREHLFLYPGDSAMGFRLPLDSLPWEPESERQTLRERDPFAPRPTLPTPDTDPRPTTPPAINVVRTALCVEVRDGNVCVFLPPLEAVEDFLELVAAIEAAASALALPVVVEGYKPPFDLRIVMLGVTPDPGVIEVNTQPAADWPELVQNTVTLYEEARLTRLSTEKFLLDGRHTGTGGGNHVVLGGPTPADSPLLRRPDLLRSFIACWNNHPSLSYLFSGLFVGPTSQHPRADEARHDALDELDLAFAQVDRNGPTPPAWLVDRLFRHLLIDSSGNTHRTELCIDKLYSPDSAAGRLGLLEFRGFEMPPHAEMSLVQQLLLRALVAWFWQTPYTRPMVRWGTELHDKFLLPHFAGQDLDDLLDELTRAGYPVQAEWFAPHKEFRFPLVGEISSHGVKLELRTAIEPWHVLGEEAGAGGTVRYVDSSVERLQVKVSGLTDPRHVVACNGRRVPLHPTGVNGEFVGGVRFRAWHPTSCYHPTIPTHAPLTFDLLDAWNDRSLGGCVYHVAHPGGRAHDTFPVNGREAEGRRMARFVPFGHTPGSVTVPPAEVSRRFPLTLDLRTAGPAGVS